MCGMYSEDADMPCGMNLCCSATGWCGVRPNRYLGPASANGVRLPLPIATTQILPTRLCRVRQDMVRAQSLARHPVPKEAVELQLVLLDTISPGTCVNEVATKSRRCRLTLGTILTFTTHLL